MSDLRSVLTALLAGLAVALSLAAPQSAGAAVLVRLGDTAEEERLSAGQVLASADVRSRSYELRTGAGSGRRLKLTGMSIRALLERAGIDPGGVERVKIFRANGSLIALTAQDVVAPPFADGPALVYSDGANVGFLRPVRPSGGPNVQDHVKPVPGVDIEVIVDGNRDLTVKANASPRRAEVGETITFTASVDDPPAGATLTYIWTFADGTTRTTSTRTVRHAYRQPDPSALTMVEVEGAGGPECASTCGGNAQVTVRVGDPPEVEKFRDTTPGAGSGEPRPGFATGGGGGGGSGGGTGSGAGSGGSSGAGRTKPKPKPERPFGTTISGVLINELGARVRKLPGGTPAGEKGPPATRGGDTDPGLALPATGLLALAAFSLGALRERRGVKLPNA